MPNRPGIQSVSTQSMRVGKSPALYVLVALLFLTAAVALATDSDWSLRVWQVDNGLPDNNVTGVAQTADGYLWVATHAGLARFDGERFVTWPLPLASDRFNSLVRALLLDRENSLWLALEAEDGLLIGLSDRTTNIFNVASGVPNTRPLVIAETADETKWAGYADGSVSSYAKGKVTHFGVRDGLAGAGGCWLATDAENNLWFAKAGGVGVFKDGHFEKCFGLPEEKIRLAAARDNGIWILAGHRLLKCTDGKTPVFIGELPTTRPGVVPSVIYEDRTGGVWLGTLAGGLFHWDGQEIVPVETSHSDITSVMEDREGNIWVGTEGGGLDRLRNRILELHGAARGLTFETARSVCEDDTGVIWATGVSGALARFVNGQWQTITNGAGWTGAAATCVVNDHHGGVWIGANNGGLFHWRAGKFSLLRRKDGLGSDTVRALLVDRHDDLWIGLETPNALQRLHKSVFQNFVSPTNSRTIRSMVEDAAGKIWLGTQSGSLLRVETNSLVDETAHALQPIKPIRALHATADGGLWIGYAGAGVGWLRDGKFSHFTVEQGLPDNNICGVESDNSGALWFTCSHGIFQVRQREFAEFAGKQNERLLALEFGRNEGLLNLQGSYGFWPNTAHGRDGRLWFTTRSGLVAAWPERLQPNRIPPVVLIEIFLVDGQSQTLTANDGRLHLPPSHHKLEIEFTALNFAAPENILLQHRLTGWDDNWSEPSKARSFTFSRLPAGRYEFQVTARNAAGVWNRDGAKLIFEVEPFLWQRWWFRLAAVAVFTGLVIAVVRYVSFRRLRAKLLRLEQDAALQRDRARIASDLHDDLGANLTQIALLSELAQNDFEKPAEARGHLDQIFRTAKSVTRSLDEIVWAINPKNDSLDRFVAHLCTYAPEFLNSSGVRCRLDVPVEMPVLTLPADVRHHLHLAVKEALHNVVKHAHASEVQLQLRLAENELVIIIADNGQGIQPGAKMPTGADGLENFRQRLAEVGGRFEQQNVAAGGTKIIFTVPLRM